MIRPWPYLAIAVFLAAPAAGSVVGLQWATLMLPEIVVKGASPAGLLPFSAFVAAVATVAFLIGLVFPGCVIWLLLHGLGLTSWRVAAMAGASCASLAGAILALATAPSLAWLAIPWLALPGAVAGLTVWWIAYQPVRPLRSPRPAPPS